VDLVAGALVTNNLRLVRKLGEGGMGTVWIAEHKALASEVVVKFLAEQLAAYDECAERFAREAALAAKVRHPNVVQVFDHGVTEDGLPYIVMELLEGRSLADDLEGRIRLTPGEVSSILTQCAKALQRVHELGFVHRDIKPENIFLCEIGACETFVKILDFGIAKARTDSTSSLTSTGVTMGTPFYMSPELILSAKNVNAQADLWALAVVAFETLTGVRPFAGETVGAVTLELHSRRRPRITELVPSLPVQLEDWFAKAFAADPADRFTDARSMARAFAAIIPPARSSFAPVESRKSRPSTEIIVQRRAAQPTEPVATVSVPVPAPRDPRKLAIGGLAAIAAIATIGVMIAHRDPTPEVAASPRVAIEPVKEARAAEPVTVEPPPPAATVAALPIASTTASAVPAIKEIAKPKPIAKPTPPRAPKTFDDIQ
jgi:eukaryotic-like serine/threonine-protein kinase